MNSKPVTRQFEDSDLHQELVTFEVPNNDLKELIFYFSHMKYHTAKTYLQWLRSWNEWYQANAGKEGNEAWPASSLPVTQPPLLSYLDYLQGSLSHSSIKGCLHALNSIHRKALDRPGIITSKVKSILASLEQAEAREQKVTRQATPFLVSDLKALIKAHGTTQSVRKLRDLCIIWTGFETLLRSAELRRIRMQDLVLNEQTGSFTLTVYRTKSTVSTLLTYHLTPHLTATLIRLMGMVKRDQQSHPKDYLFQAVNFQDSGYMPPGWGLRSKGNEINTLLKNHNMPYRPTRPRSGKMESPLLSMMRVCSVKTHCSGPLKRFGMNFIRRKRAPDAGLVTALGLAAPSNLLMPGTRTCRSWRWVTGAMQKWFPAISVTLTQVRKR